MWEIIISDLMDLLGLGYIVKPCSYETEDGLCFCIVVMVFLCTACSLMEYPL
jgi:hypothetical protein